jgi:glycosyltransferase involved in cell wall biosynthesis
MITGEFPPQLGGVADYTAQVAAGLAAAGDEVHVWCPPAAGSPLELPGVVVHPELGRLGPRDWSRLGRSLDRFPRRRKLLVQWVPHAFGRRSMNLPFCAWLWLRSIARREEIEIMVHEPYLAFEGSWAQRSAALVHRAMTVLLLQSAARVWVSIPTWESRWKPYALGRSVPFRWLPVPSNAPYMADPAGVREVRARFGSGGLLLGHFGTYGRLLSNLLGPVVVQLLRKVCDLSIVLIGRGGESFREIVAHRHPELGDRVAATGSLHPADLSRHLQACDLLIQPFPDGVSSRRTTVMAALAHGRPVVTTTGGLTESLWSDSNAVALAPAGDWAGLVAMTLRALRDPDERDRLGARGAELYRDHFDLAHTIRALRGV